MRASSLSIFILAVVSSVSQAAVVSYYSFDQTSGTTLYDQVGSNDGTVNGAQWNAGGLFGGAMKFDGTNDYVVIPTGNSFDFSKSFSLSVWVKTVTQPTGDMDWFTYNNGASGRSVVNRIYNYGRARFSFYGANLDTAASAVPFGTWAHLAVTHNTTTGMSTIYINGQIAAMSDVGRYVGPLSFATIGKWDVSFQNQNYYNGLMDELKIYDNVLSQSEIAAMIPEPMSLVLFGLGLAGVRRMKK